MSTQHKFIGVAVGMLVCLVSSWCYAQEWIRTYNGPYNDDDFATAIAVDDYSNVYVTGWIFGSGFYDYATIKYNSTGDTLWIRTYNGPGNGADFAPTIAVDDSGNVYVTGFSEGFGTSLDYATIKYNPTGDTLWVRRYNGRANGVDGARAIAVDDCGNVYVTGGSEGSGTSADYATIKYNSFGDTLWVRRYNGPGNGVDSASAIAVDDSGNVYVTGYSIGSGAFYDYATIKYNSFGDTLWARRYNGLGGNSYDRPTALAVDGTGNIFVTGYTGGYGHHYDYATIKYNSTGDTLWIRTYNGLGINEDDDYANAIAVDSSGNVYVTGVSAGRYSSDYVTIKYNAFGDTLWVGRYDGGIDDGASALAVDGMGYVYVTGYSRGLNTADDYATIKYSPMGIVEERNRFTDARNNKLTIYPNPATEKINIKYTIHDTGCRTYGIKIYDATGRLVKTFNHLTNHHFNEVAWFGEDDLSCRVLAGVYFVCLEACDYNAVEKVVLLR